MSITVWRCPVSTLMKDNITVFAQLSVIGGGVILYTVLLDVLTSMFSRCHEERKTEGNRLVLENEASYEEQEGWLVPRNTPTDREWCPLCSKKFISF